MRKIIVILALLALWAPRVQAQDKALMADYQSQLQALFEQVYTAPTDNERYHANESALELLSEALGQEDSFKWQWDFGTRVSVLTAPDGKFRIFTWPVVNDEGEYECFGFVQSLDEKKEQYDVYPLYDKSQEIVNRQEDILTHDNWFGSVYQELITTTDNGKTYYTLLGWSGVDLLTQRKVIEPICFKSSRSQPQFGQNLFRKERNIRRVVLEYTNNAMVTLRYEEQFIRTVEHIRAKRKGGRRSGLAGLFRPRSPYRGRAAATAARTSRAQKERVTSGPSVKTTDKKYTMIIFDEVAPQILGMEGLYQYYVPSGVELAYMFVDGRWELHQGAQGRVEDKRLNQDFDKPLEKKAPAYQLGARERK